MRQEQYCVAHALLLVLEGPEQVVGVRRTGGGKVFLRQKLIDHKGQE